MIDDPVVETINAILNGEDNFILLLQRPQLERIRDEIVALRAVLDIQKRLPDQIAVAVRDEALEEAALECEARFCDGCADAIRTLKGER